MSDRRQKAHAVRLEAAELARSREHLPHRANGEEQRYANERYFMSFTKGLPHNPDTGLLQEARDFVEFRRAIDDGFIDPFSDNDRVRHGAKFEVINNQVKPVSYTFEALRPWEAPTAGHVFELEGPDPQSVTMAPAPPLIDPNGQVNAELVLEMAEVYELAVLRDLPLNDLENGRFNQVIADSLDRLNALSYIGNQTQRPRKVNAAGQLDAQAVFRGSSPGVEVGPYLSQFLLIGSVDRNGGGSVIEGQINYGSIAINQRVAVAEPGKDYMTTMPDYVRVQRGIDPPNETYGAKNGFPITPPARPPRRFISTPRDLATYVHYDELFQAYLNACILLLGMGTPFDPAFDHLSGVGEAAANPATRRNAGGFALFGGPHILTLLTEVATRALKAVRYQKFNSHLRLRPEALAARIELVRLADGHCADDLAIPDRLKNDVGALRQALVDNGTLQAIANGPGNGTYLLPMAFPEGSPMHPSYGAGHGTVAGACATILKAFFDTSAIFAQTPTGGAFKRYRDGDMPVIYRAPSLPNPDTGEGVSVDDLTTETPDRFLTLEGELNKLAANISIARNMAGVHYFSDYYDSLRMGEQIAIGILEEQALTYSTDAFVLSVPTFDGETVRIG